MDQICVYSYPRNSLSCIHRWYIRRLGWLTCFPALPNPTALYPNLPYANLATLPNMKFTVIIISFILHSAPSRVSTQKRNPCTVWNSSDKSRLTTLARLEISGVIIIQTSFPKQRMIDISQPVLYSIAKKNPRATLSFHPGMTGVYFVLLIFYLSNHLLLHVKFAK